MTATIAPMTTMQLARLARRIAAVSLRGDARKPLIVGELNPCGGRPEFALFPLPRNRSGGRLAGFLGLGDAEYLERFDRRNLCGGTFVAGAAKLSAASILAEHRPALVLLGKKVCAAFGVEYAPFTVDEVTGFSAAILPHPSGKNLAWNDARAPELAREVVALLLRHEAR